MKKKYPCIECTQQLYNKIKNILKVVGYKESCLTDFEYDNILTINSGNVFGQISNVSIHFIKGYNHYLCSNIRDFLTVACKLKKF